MTAPDPRDVERFDEWSRELFGGGCTHVLQTLPPRMAQARFHRSSDREIRRRMWWWRLKRALKSREVWITALVLALALAFMAGRGFSEEVRSKPSGVEGHAWRDRGLLQHMPEATTGITRNPTRESARSFPAQTTALRRAARVANRASASAAAVLKPGLGFDRASGETQRAAQWRTPEPCPSTFGDDGLPPVTRARFEECRARALRDDGMLKVWAGLVVLLAVLSAIAAIHWMDRNMSSWLGAPEDEGRVSPRRPWE